MRFQARFLLIGAALAVLLFGCAGEEAGDTSTEEAAPDASATEAPATEDATEAATPTEPADDAAADDGGGALAAAATDLGEVVVDGEGMTLYMFDPDEGGEPTCYEDCAASWPPLLTDGEPQAGEGLDAALLGTVERTDGTTQVTYNGWPLYHWAADEEPGDVGGQGVGGAWWVLGPDGTPMREG